ncbi:hypothetical protein IB227_00680 [Stenotrophomonas sp. STM01]|uniref:hypothetical protein n=1 Tax=unclassified Stenotrophomonas TaxID=196198 RepID=UPI00177C4E4B|nr:hypothetical protein [Stenotrophomonas sp. STM01]MBD9534364.1 hypothetical protein [Stenotrophomonas sp. STM01]
MNNDASALLQALHVDLDLIKNAIEAEDHATTERIVGEHDQRVRDYLHAHGAHSAPQALQNLLEQQLSLTTRMRQLRDEAAQYLRAERQSTRAANAYLQAGTLA